MNIFIAGMFVASFLTIAHLNPGFGHVRWFALSYGVGILTPLAEFILPLSPVPTPFMILSYAGVLSGIVLLAPAISLLHGKQPAWRIGSLIILIGLFTRGLIWGGQRNEFWYELTYQIPFSCAALFCAVITHMHGRKMALDRALTGLFVAISVHFVLKPFAAVYFGSGATASDYIKSNYATISQASSGLLLIAAGLLLLIKTLQVVVLKDRIDAISDPLTGLANRRGLHAAFERIAQGKQKIAAAVAVFDIDHFKRINDTWGHDKGDDVICAVAKCIEATSPVNSTVARLGGEEFVLLFPWQNGDLANLTCENIRMAVAQISFRPLEAVTVSVGLTSVAPHEDLSAVLKRADMGLYKAKAGGRNRSIFEPPKKPQTQGNVNLRVVK
jgi:diguanylate cyclase (GGDEF)-like protein